MNAMQSRADLHTHSKHSDRPSEWLLRRIGAPESFVEPLEVYETCRARGMDFVTITDHNRIDGALEIAHRPGTFISAEVTTYFPEDGCKVHCLVHGIMQEQFKAIQQVRESIYELRRLLVEQDIVHSIAHPLFSVHDRLTVDHIEKLMLLFNRFEGLNGSVSARSNKVANAVFRSLTADTIDRLAARHGIEPLGRTPWLKTFSGGSDDHSGVYLGGACTVTPRAASAEEFLRYLRLGAQEMAGTPGNSLRFAHSLYHIAYGYYRECLLNSSKAKNPLIGAIFRKLLDGQDAPAPTLRQKMGDLVGRLLLSAHKKRLSKVDRLLVEQLQQLFDEPQCGMRDGARVPTDTFDQQTFRTACRLSQEFGYTFLKKCVDYAREGELAQCVQTVSALGPVALGIAPYLASFASQHKDERLIQEAAQRFGFSYLVDRSRRAAWLADTLDGGQGADPASLCEEVTGREQDITLVTCTEAAPPAAMPARNFAPVGRFAMPDGVHTLAFPPFLEVIAYIERQSFSHLYISSPGPLGLTGLAAARLLGLKTTGICQSDYPRLVREFTGDDSLGALTWRYLAWFYGQMDAVIVPDEDRRFELSENGIDLDKLVVMAPGEELGAPALAAAR